MPLELSLEELRFGTDLLKRGFAKMQKGGVIMDVTNAEQAAIAEEAGAVAVMSLERVPADIREAGGVARMADPRRVREIVSTVTIPVMAKTRIGHVLEAQALESLGVDMVDESEVLTPADPYFHIDKRDFTIPFVCGCRSLGEAVRRIWEGAAMIRTKGEAGTGNVIEAVRHMHLLNRAISELKALDSETLRRVAAHYAEGYTRLLAEVRESQGQPRAVSKDDIVFGGNTVREIEEGLLEVILDVRGRQR
ncbi:MAG: pyridoxal 5'-phosphate synthase lyase subunit PdxS, partial [Thermoplasmata archaeon]